MGDDLSAVQEVLARAEIAIKKGNYQEGAQLAKQGFQAVQQAQFQRVVAVLGTSREKFAAAANMGVDLKGPFEDLNTAREAIRRGAFQGRSRTRSAPTWPSTRSWTGTARSRRG